MAGRHRGQMAAATALGAMNDLFMARQAHDQKLRDTAQEMKMQFDQEAKLEMMRQGRMTYDPSTGSYTQTAGPDYQALVSGLGPKDTLGIPLPGGMQLNKTGQPSALDIFRELEAIRHQQTTDAVAQAKVNQSWLQRAVTGPDAPVQASMGAIPSTNFSATDTDPVVAVRMNMTTGEQQRRTRSGRVLDMSGRVVDIN